LDAFSISHSAIAIAGASPNSHAIIVPAFSWLKGATTGREEGAMKLLGHSIHPMLIVFPLGLLGMGTIFDLIYSVRGGPADFPRASYWMIAAGIVTGLGAALFGLIDWLGVPGRTRAKAVGAWHGVGNVIVVSLLAGAWLLRGSSSVGSYSPNGTPMALEAAGLILALVTGWLGGELIERLGVGVHEGAHLDAPSSLSVRPAIDQPRSAPGGERAARRAA
jgi:uncharacterized membrane protein